ncbi:MAG: 30S ribosomal protein S9 [Euryarchaeota archaeon]|nr:30S ribosomal protein S9 [Euryarchaeota archaeon]
MVKIVHVSGKRKTAIARATVKKGSGVVRVNKKLIDIIQPELAKLKLMEPLVVAADAVQKVNIDVSVVGGGVMGQAEAARTAIARGLVGWDSKLKKKFLEYDRTLLAGDPRRKEPKKTGGRGARKRRQKSYR